jgi:hypothetical protein
MSQESRTEQVLQTSRNSQT